MLKKFIFMVGLLFVSTITITFLFKSVDDDKALEPTNHYVYFMIEANKHERVKVVDNQVTLPNEVLKQDYVFNGWVLDNTMLSPRFNHENVQESKRVYALFTPSDYEPTKITIPLTVIIDGEDNEHDLMLYSDVLNITLEEILEKLEISVFEEEFRNLQWYFNDEEARLYDSFTITQLEERAVFEVIQHQVSRQIIIDANGGTFDGYTTVNTFWGNEISDYITLTELKENVSREDYILSHWVVIQSDGEFELTQENLETLIIPNEDITIKAQWASEYFTITIDLNDDGISRATATQLYIDNVSYGTNVKYLLSEIMVKSNSHLFGSWYKPSTTVTENMIVTVIWGEIRAFTVMFDLNDEGVIGAIAPIIQVTAIYGTNLALFINQFPASSDSHLFERWDIPSMILTENTTVTAIWGDVITFRVTIDLNDYEVINAKASQMYFEDVSFGTNLATLLSGVTVTSDSHLFFSWDKPSPTVTEDITVTVIWGEFRLFVVSLDLNDEGVTGATALSNYISLPFGTLLNDASLDFWFEVRSDSHFFGSWYMPKTIVTEDITVTVIWGDVRTFRVTIDLNDDEVTNAKANYIYIENVLFGTDLATLLLEITVTSDSHVFGSWDKPSPTVTEDMTVTVIWGTVRVFMVTLDLNDEGVTGATALSNYILLTFNTLLNDDLLDFWFEVRSDSHFFGSWYMPTTLVTEDMVVTVIWGDARTFRVTVDLNDAEVTNAKASQMYFEDVLFGTYLPTLLSEITVTSDSHAFLSWDKPSSTVTQDITVTVIWGYVRTFRVTINLNDDEVTNAKANYMYFENVSYGTNLVTLLSRITVTSDSHVFGSWDKPSPTVTEDMTVTVIWGTVRLFVVSLDLNDEGVTGATALNNHIFLQFNALLDDALLDFWFEVRSDSHFFLSWYKPTTIVTEDVTVTVIWGYIRTFRVTVDLNDDEVTNAKASQMYFEDISFGTNLATLLSEVTVTSDSHIFLSWYKPSPTVTQDITVTVIWGLVRTFIVTINLNDEDVINASASQRYIENVSYGTDLANLLSEITVTSDSHAFGSWEKPSPTVTQDMTVTVIWGDAKTFVVTINLNDDEVTNARANYMYIGNVLFGTSLVALLLGITVTSDSHLFGSWDVPSPTVTEDITVTVIWGAAITFRVTIDLNEEGITNANASQMYIENVLFGTNLVTLLLQITVTSDSHRFVGWDILSPIVTEDMTVAVIWGVSSLFVLALNLNEEGVIGATSLRRYVIVQFGLSLNDDKLNALFQVRSDSHMLESWDMPSTSVTKDMTITVIWREKETYQIFTQEKLGTSIIPSEDILIMTQEKQTYFKITIDINGDEIANKVASQVQIEDAPNKNDLPILLEQLIARSASHLFESRMEH